MRERATVASGVGNDANGAGLFNPLFRGQGETVQAGLHSDPVEFHGIRTGVVEPFPDAEKFDRIAVSQPVTHKVVSAFVVLITRNVRKAEVIFVLPGEDGDSLPGARS